MITGREAALVRQEELQPAAVPAAGLLPAGVLRLQAALRPARSDCKQTGTSLSRGSQALLVISFSNSYAGIPNEKPNPYVYLVM
jgi:hypothetical protein